MHAKWVAYSAHYVAHSQQTLHFLPVWALLAQLQQQGILLAVATSKEVASV
jgi:phosphoglycolate phosphatase-like HAD superfamily hydrolase